MKIRIGGVPEYFNLPVRLAIENGRFEDQGLDVEWVEYLQGTGKMANDLANGSLDLAVLLTEGAVKAIYEGNPSKIVKTHVNSPLIWGIYVPHAKKEHTIEEALEKVIAISRYGSGSHLMVVHLALQMNIPVESLNFLVVNDLQGARIAFKNKQADVFFWEKYTTKPLVDSGDFYCIGQHVSPWPPFVLVASDRLISLHDKELQAFLSVVNESVDETRSKSNLQELIAERYSFRTGDVSLLLRELNWNNGFDTPASFEEEILSTFQRAKILGAEKRSELFFNW